MDRASSSSAGENRTGCLARDTTAYYEWLTLPALEEENSIADSLARAVTEIDLARVR